MDRAVVRTWTWAWTWIWTWTWQLAERQITEGAGSREQVSQLAKQCMHVYGTEPGVNPGRRAAGLESRPSRGGRGYFFFSG